MYYGTTEDGTSGSRNSGVAIPPRSRMRETDAVSHEKFFEYLGYHFEPVGISEYSTTLTDNHQYTLIEWCSPPLYGVHDSLYTQKSFCETAKTSIPDVDVYYCKETAKYYIPGKRSLFEYSGRIHTYLRDMDQEERSKKAKEKRPKPPVLSRK